MKKLALLALAAPAFAGTPEPVVTAAPAPAPAAPCCALELGAGYNFAAKDLFKQFPNKEIDTVGIDLTAVHSFTPKHAITFRIGAAQGDEMEPIHEGRAKTYLRTVSIMPGYRFTQPVSEKTSLFCGVNAGLVNQHVHVKESYTGDTRSEDDSAWGWGATAEAGVRYQLCPCSEIFAAYQLSGNTVHNDFGHHMQTHRQIHNGVRAGVSIKF